MSASTSHQGLLVLPMKDTLDSIKGIIGEEVVNQLKKNSTVQLNIASLELMTKNIHPRCWADSVLVLYPSQKLLNKVETLQTPSEILVVL